MKSDSDEAGYERDESGNGLDEAEALQDETGVKGNEAGTIREARQEAVSAAVCFFRLI